MTDIGRGVTEEETDVPYRDTMPSILTISEWYFKLRCLSVYTKTSGFSQFPAAFALRDSARPRTYILST